MSPKKKYETLVSIDVERLKKILDRSDTTQIEISRNIGITPEHFSRTYKKGAIYESWLDVICDMCDINSEFIKGTTEAATTRLGELRKLVDPVKAIKNILISGGFEPNIADGLTNDNIQDIRDVIYYICTRRENPIDNMYDYGSSLEMHIKEQDEIISKLNHRLQNLEDRIKDVKSDNSGT